MGGGGGGTGAVGADGRDQPGNGGTGAQFSNYTGNKIGLPFLNPLAGRYAGGGGGMDPEVPAGKDGGTGGAGGGGRGARSRPHWYGSPGLVFTGSGGGGGQWWIQLVLVQVEMVVKEWLLLDTHNQIHLQILQELHILMVIGIGDFIRWMLLKVVLGLMKFNSLK